LLHYDLLRLGAYPTLGILRGYRNYAFTLGKRRRVVAEGAVSANHRNLLAIYHDASTGIGLSAHLNHMAMLHQGIKFKSQSCIGGLRDDGELVVLALYRLSPLAVDGLHRPVISAFRQSARFKLWHE